MKTFFKSLLIFIFILILLLVGMLYTVNVNKYKYLFEEALSKMWGMNVKIQGPMQLNFIPNPHVDLNNVKIGYDLKNKNLDLTIKDLFVEITWDSFYKETMTLKGLKAKDLSLKYIENQKVIHALKIDNMSAKIISSFQHVEVPNFSASIENVKMKGNLAISFDHNSITIDGNLTLPKYQVLFPENNKIDQARDFFKKLNLYLSLRDIKASGAIIIDKLQYADKVFDNAHFAIDLKKKVLNVGFWTKSNDDYSGRIVLKQNDNQVPQMNGELKIVGKDKKRKVMGQGDVLFSNIPTLNAKVDLTEWTLPTLIKKAPQGRVFSSTPISVDLFSQIQGDIQLHIDTLKWQGATFSNFEAKLNITPAKVEIQTQGNLNRGQFVGNIRMSDHSKPEYAIFADMRLTNAMASEVIKLFDENAPIAGGQLDVDFKGHSYGNNIASWMANVSGKTMFHLRNMTLLHQTIDARYVDAFVAFLRAFQPKDQETTLDCVAWRLDLREGIASSNQSIALETNEIYAMGTGVLDLGTETLDFTFDLHPRSELNLEVGALDNVVHLQGTLAEMKLVSSPAGLIREGGTIALGIATGGISLLAEKLLKMATKHSSPCQEVLQER